MTLTRVVRSLKMNKLHLYEQYEYSLEKDTILLQERGISFENVISAIENSYLLEIIDHHNQPKYPNQKVFVVQVKDYVYAVPFIEKNTSTAFLKTIFKNRKLKKRYLP